MGKIIRWAIVSFLVFFSVTAGFLYFRLGAFKPVELQLVESATSMTILYKKHQGPYHEIIQTINEVENWAKSNGVDCPETFGEYLDNPAATDPDRLRSHGGCIINNLPPQSPDGFNIRTIEFKQYLQARFDGSPAIGPMKVYPKAQEWFRQNPNLSFSGTTMEIYKILPGGEEMQTTYLFPIN